MCGIAGFVGVGPGAASIDGLDAMQRALAHRGPDGFGVWRDASGRVGFAHRRLSIIDLSESASQPMTSHDGRLTVTYNGEIYNHRALRRELSAAGATFKTDHSDTEVILEGFRVWGMEGMLARLNGIFAFALYDARTGVTYLVRDPVGVKPLYYMRREDGILFASEIKGMAVYPGFEASPSPLAAFHFLSFMTAPAPLTLFNGVYKTPPGVYLEISPDGAIAWRRYFDFLTAPAKGPRHDFDGAVETVRDLFTAAVERQCESDVPVGVFLSGGVDSTAVASIASERMPGRLSAFSVGFSDHTELNEVEEAAAVAKDLGIDHHVVMIEESDMLGYVDRLARDQDEPIADWVCVPLYFVSQLARDQGVKVVLVGEGADEQFCGYPVYQRYLELARREWRVARMLSRLGLAGLGARLLAARANGDFGGLTRADFLRRADAGQELFWGGAVVWWDMLKERLIDDGFPAGEALSGPEAEMAAEVSTDRQDSGAFISAITRQARVAGRDRLGEMTYLELRHRLPELLLMRVDKITMANSLEARVPFLDPELAAYSASLDQKEKIPGGALKALFKEAMRGRVPDRVLDAKKRGFGAPMSDWLRGGFAEQCRTRIMDGRFVRDRWIDGALVERLFDEHRRGDGDNAVFLWTLFNLSAWSDCWTGR